jgi:hypothetical protein
MGRGFAQEGRSSPGNPEANGRADAFSRIVAFFDRALAER